MTLFSSDGLRVCARRILIEMRSLDHRVAGAAEHVMAALITEDEQDVGVAVAHGSAPFLVETPRIRGIANFTELG